MLRRNQQQGGQRLIHIEPDLSLNQRRGNQQQGYQGVIHLTTADLSLARQNSAEQYGKQRSTNTFRAEQIDERVWRALANERFKERKTLVIDEKLKKAFLVEFYGENPVDVDISNTENNLEKVRRQVNKICNKLITFGFTNLEGLEEKFSSVFVEGSSPSSIKQIKEYLESMLFLVCNASEAKRIEYADLFKKREFFCATGTESNVVRIFTEMTMGKQNLDAIIAHTKREIVEQAILELFRKGSFADSNLGTVQGMMTHDVQSLVNTIADEFGLNAKTKAEDETLKDVPQHKVELLKNELKKVFNNKETLNQLAKIVLEKVVQNLPTITDKKDGLRSEIDEYLEQLGINRNYTLIATVDEKGEVIGYKHNFCDVLSCAVNMHLAKAGVIKQETSWKRNLELEESTDVQGKSAISKSYLAEKGYSAELTSEDWHYIFQNGILLDVEEFGTANPFDYASKNKFSINGKGILQTYIENNFEIKGIKAEFYALIAKVTLTEDERKNCFKARDENGNTALHYFAAFGNLALVNEILSDPELAKQVTSPRNSGALALHEAAKNGKLDVLKVILFKSEDSALTVQDSDGNTALHLATYNGHANIAIELTKTEKGKAALNLVNHYNSTPLHSAASNGYIDIAQAFIAIEEGKLALNSRDKEGCTPLHLAAYKGRIDVVKAFLATVEGRSSLESKNNMGCTPLHLAAYKGHALVVKETLSIEEGCRTLNVLDNEDGRAALHYAVMQGHREIADDLIKTAEGKKVICVKDKVNGHTPFHIAVINGRAEIVKAFLATVEGRAALSIKDESGCTPLQHAVNCQNSEIIKAIVSTSEGFASSYIKDGNGNLPILPHITLFERLSLYVRNPVTCAINNKLLTCGIIVLAAITCRVVLPNASILLAPFNTSLQRTLS